MTATTDHENHDAAENTLPDSSPTERSLRLRLAPWLCALLSLVQSFGANLIIIPLNRLVEINLCREYYLQHDPSVLGPSGDIEESLCKEKSIQVKLAWIIGLISTLGLVCEVLVTVPFGYVSDKYGRKLVLFLNAIAVLMAFSWVMIVGYAWKTFPIEAIIVAPFFYLFGGNVNVASTNILAIIADVAKDTSQRTRIFGYQHAVGAVLRLLSPVISSFALTQNLWLPFWIGIISFSLTFPMIAALPDTRRQSPSVNGEPNRAPESESEPLMASQHHNIYEEATDSLIPENSEPLGEIFRQRLQKICGAFRKEINTFVRLFKHSRNVSLCLTVFLVTTLARTVTVIMVQYISNRYHWSIAQAGYLLTVKAGVNLLLFTTLIPLFLSLVTQRAGKSEMVASVYGAKASIILCAVGSLAIGLSPLIWLLIISMVLYALGTGLSLFLLSLLTSETFGTLDEQHTARVFSAVGLIETLGEMSGIPLLSSAWICGIKVGGMGLGLPFYVCSGLYSIAGLAVWNLRVV